MLKLRVPYHVERFIFNYIHARVSQHPPQQQQPMLQLGYSCGISVTIIVV